MGKMHISSVFRTMPYIMYCKADVARQAEGCCADVRMMLCCDWMNSVSLPI